MKNMYLAIAVIVLLLVIFFVGKSYGKNKPPNAINVPDDDVDGVISYDPTSLTDALYKDIKGVSLLGYHDTTPYFELNKLSDGNLVIVMNDWDNRYYGKNKETLFEAISNEYFLFNQIDTVNAIVSRLKKLEATRKK